MSSKIRITQRHINKVLDYISTYKKSVNGIVLLNNDFYGGLLMSNTKITQTLNAMTDYHLIEVISPANHIRPAQIKLTSAAFSYRLLQRRELFRFALPTIISIVALIKSFNKELLLLLELIMQLLK